MKALLSLVLAAVAQAQFPIASYPDNSSVVHFRVVFTTGSSVNPTGKAGVANLTAAMLARGGTKSLEYRQLVDALFPMGTSVNAQVDQDMVAFSASTHVDNLELFYQLFKSMLLEPGWRTDDFARLKDEARNALTVELRSNNDEELGKEVLYSAIYAGKAYEFPNIGTVSGINRITLNDLRAFYRAHFVQANMAIGLAGGYKPAFVERVRRDFSVLPKADRTLEAGAGSMLPVEPAAIGHSRAVFVKKDTRSVAFSFGFPIMVRRGDPDYAALLLAQTYLGQHRTGGRLYDRIREVRGLNYGDYAYIEHFPRGMFTMEPPSNIARRSQIFQIWIRPVEPEAAAFALKLAHYELHKLIHDGIPEDAFERTKENLSKFADVLTRTRQAQLGYAIDSMYYRMPPYATYLKQALAKLTRQEVNVVIRRWLRANRIQFVAVTGDPEGLAAQLTSGQTVKITYNSPKPADVVAEDKIVSNWDIGLRKEDIEIVPVERVFE